MKRVTYDGKEYFLMEWCKPEESDVAFGETVIAVYAAAYSHPYHGVDLAVCIDDKNHLFRPLFRSHHSVSDGVQPLYVIELPPVGEKSFVPIPENHIGNKVGDVRDETD